MFVKTSKTYLFLTVLLIYTTTVQLRFVPSNNKNGKTKKNISLNKKKSANSFNFLSMYLGNTLCENSNRTEPDLSCYRPKADYKFSEPVLDSILNRFYFLKFTEALKQFLNNDLYITNNMTIKNDEDFNGDLEEMNIEMSNMSRNFLEMHKGFALMAQNLTIMNEELIN